MTRRVVRRVGFRTGQRVARAILAPLAFALAARAAPGQQFPHRAVISLPGHAAPILLDTIGFSKDLKGVPPFKAFAALQIVYKELAIPTNVDDAAQRYVGNLQLTKMHNVAGMQMSQVIECGLDMNGPRADQYRVHLVIVSRIDSVSPAESRIRSTVVAGAEDIQGPSKDPIPCGSTGSLEAKIARLVEAHTRSP